MTDENELETEFERLISENKGASQANYGDQRTTKAIGYLGMSILRLDKTSTRLTRINIGLGVVMALAGVAQVLVAICRR
jgi:hypothetical protein